MKFSLTLEIYRVTFDLCEIIHFSTIIYFMFKGTKLKYHVMSANNGTTDYFILGNNNNDFMICIFVFFNL
jgi:hypothetical protein